MTELSLIDPLQLRQLILNARHPIVLRNVKLDWDISRGTLEDWCRQYDKAVHKKPVEFQKINRDNGLTPQYERFREDVRMTTMKFLEQYSTEQEHWMALNYKRPSEIPKNCRKGVQFDCFGFPDGDKDCAYWLGSSGANTPCHYDSYGCNVVVQVFGRKSWLLFPPEAPLETSRIPYEESSVYCTHNFYSPNPGDGDKQFEEIENFAYHCVLEANSVLVVPRHWWHFVEALDLSLSVNYWVPLQTDRVDQLDECLVQNIVKEFVNANDYYRKVESYILNPNECSLLNSNNFTKFTLDELMEDSDSTEHPYQTLTEEQFEELLKKLPIANRVGQMTAEKFRQFIATNSKRYNENFELEDDDDIPISTEQQVYLNSLCSPTVVQSLRQEFCKRYKNTN